MNDAEKSKLEQKLKEAAPVLNRLGDGPSVLPDHIKARLNSALDKKFPQNYKPQTINYKFFISPIKSCNTFFASPKSIEVLGR